MVKRKHALEKNSRGHHEASAVTPVGVKKQSSNTGKENISMTTCYTAEILENSERRITRSVSRQMREKLGFDCEMTTENIQVDVDLFKFCESESKKRRAVHSAGQMRGANCDMGKDKTVSRGVRESRQCQLPVNHEKDDKVWEVQQAAANSKGKIVLGLCVQMVQRRSTCTSSFSARNKECSKVKKKKSENLGVSNYLGIHSELEKRMTRSSCAAMFLNNEKGCKSDHFRQILGNSDRVVTRSASKILQGKTDICRQMVVRERSHTSSKVSARKVEYPHAMEKVENQLGKRMTRSSIASFSVIHEKDDRGDGYQRFVGNLDRMVTRSASKPLHEKIDFSGSSRVLMRKKEKKKKIENTNLAKCPGNQYRSQKRMSCSAGASSSINPQKEGEKDECAVKQPQKRITRRLDGELDKVGSDVISVVSSSGGAALRKSRDGIGGETKLIGVERNSGKTRVQGTTNQGWTKDQETALQNAFLTANPSPHFWKKVAKLVPGKTAQQCFDKMNSNIQTPPSTQPLSRIRKGDSPPILSFPVSKLVKSAEKKSKKTRKAKPKSHIAHRNARHLLQKYTHVKHNSEADLFSVLEPTVNPSTPINKLVSPGSASLSRKKRLSRFSGVGATPLTSPPVLKKVKNLALHEKYIDQLHMREAKRKAASTRYLKAMRLHKNEEENSADAKDAIKAAKDALCCDAKDAIHKFQQSQGDLMGACSDSEELFCSDEDELEESTS